MKKWLISGMVCIVVLMVTVSFAYADSPTPTPTLRPIPATATSASIFLRPTPTQLSIIPASYPPFETDAGTFADYTIGMYNWFNRDHLIDFMMSGFIIVAVAIYLVKNLGGITKGR